MNTLKSRPEVLRDLDLHNLWHPFTQHQVWCEEEPLIIERGEGFRLVDIDGRSYLDGVSSLWCNVHGHGDPDLLLALHEQVDMLCHSTLLGLSHRPILELTKRLLKVVPKNLSRAFYSDSGSAAVEAALRMSVEWWQKKPASISARKKHKIVSLASGYHGDTLGAVGLGYLPEFHEHLQPLLVPSIKINPPHVYRLIGGSFTAPACSLDKN
jgi:adenosylmethionine-8-amino-7-oxononanoate aminotransferase